MEEMENGVCIISTPENEEWRNSAGLLHRLDGPALYSKDVRSQLITSGGISHEEIVYGWCINGLLHRLDGPASYTTTKKFYSDEPHKIISVHNMEMWYDNGLLHRIGGPAITDESTNFKEWWQNGKLHRLDGPARISNSVKYYFINGCELSYEMFTEYKKLLELNVMFITTLQTMKKSQDDVGEVDGYYYIPKELMDSLLEKSASP